MIILYRIGMLSFSAWGLYDWKAAVMAASVAAFFFLTKDIKIND